MTVRVAAARALLAIDRREATLGTILDETRRTLVDERDRALFGTLVTGVLRERNALDAVIASASRRSVRQIENGVLVVLRLGTYQLRYLDRVPDHAIVNESVATLRTLGFERAAGLVNATLRAIIRRGPAISLPAKPEPTGHLDAQVSYLSITLSHPAWLVRRWIERLGFEAAEAWCRFNNTPPEVTVRALDDRPLDELQSRLSEAGVAAEKAPYVADALCLPAGTLGRLPAELRDRLWVQDEGAQLVARFAHVHPGERVLDVCAAPGGKTLVMATDLHLRAAGARHGLVAADYRKTRVTLLKETLRRAQVPASVVRFDARVGLPFKATFDCVILDAPCSGLGTIRREPDLKWTRTADDLPRLAAEQRRMIASAADAVRPGGRLVYATCSSEPEENAEIVDAFLANDNRFTEAPANTTDVVPSDLLDRRGHLVTRPDAHRLEAFYAAVLVRHQGT